MKSSILSSIQSANLSSKSAARRAHVFAFLSVLLLSAPAFAQATTADLVGRVTDGSGAVLPGATVTVTHTGTGQVRTQVASDTGDYAFNLLPIGTYEITIELQGFKTQTARMALASGDRARVDGKLEVGAVTETVTVTADAPLLQTDSANVSSLWTEKLVQELPVQERNVYRFVQLVPGAHEGAVSSSANGTRPDERRQTVAVSVNGATDIENNLTRGSAGSCLSHGWRRSRGDRRRLSVEAFRRS